MAATFFFKRDIPLRLFLIVPFVVQTVTAVMITGWLAHRNGRRAVQELGNQLLTETSDRITQELHTYTDIPRQVMRANIDALDLQQLDLNNLNSWSQHLYRQSQRHPAINFIYFGDDQGRYVEVEKKYGDRYEFSIQESIADNTASYTLNQQGLPERFLRTLPYDPRQRPWYKKATASGQATWTAVYEFAIVYPTLGISFVQPYYDASGKQQGVLGADFTLQDISQHLNTLEIGRTGEAFIIERSGNLIASSYSESPGMPGQQQQAALSANQKLLRDTIAHLERTLGELETIGAVQQLRFERENGTHLVRVTPYVDEYGLDWLVLVAIPEADFAGQIQTNSRNTLLLCLLSLGGTIALGVFTARWVSDPLRRLGEASQAIAREEIYQRIAPSRIREINRLVQNFNRMGTELLQSRSRLEEHFQQLDTLVDQRTRALRQSEEKFVKIFQASPNGITLSTLEEGRFLDVNDRCAELFGRPKEDLIGRTSTELNIWVEPNTRADYQQQVVAGCIRNQEWQLRTASGAIKTVLLSAETIDVQGTLCVLSIANDISDRQQAQAQLQEREARHRNLFESSPISLWEEDFSAAKAYIDQLCVSEQITDFPTYVDTHPEVVETFIAKIRILNVNQAAVELHEASQKSDLLGRIEQVMGPDSFAGFKRELIALQSGEVCVEEEVIGYTLTGKPKHLLIRVFIAPVHQATWARVLVAAIDITDRKHAEEQLRQSEERWQLALRGNSDGIWDWNLGTNEIFYSQRWKEMLGYADTDISSGEFEWQSRIHPEDVDRVLQATEAHLKQAIPYFAEEYRLRCKNGQYKWILDRGQALWDETGTPLRMVGSHTDISDRKRMEEALHASQTKFQRLVDDIGDKFVIFSHTGADGIVTYVSSGFTAVFGLPKEDVIGRPWASIIEWLPQDTEIAQAAVLQAVEDTADFQQFEMRFIHPNGSQRTILVSQHPVRDRTGTLTAIEGILENITNRKLAEEKLHQSRTSLAIAQRIAHVGNWAINLKTRKTVWSVELYRIFGFDPSHPPPSYAQALRRVHPEDRDRWTGVWRRLITTGTPYEEDFRVVLPGGDLRYIEGRGEGIQDEQGEVARIFGTGLDITERKQVEAQLRRSEADLAAAQRIAHVGSWSFDASAQRIRWSEETFRIFGLDPNDQEPSYEALAAMVHPDDRKLWDQIVNRSLVEKTSHHHEFRFFRPNGELRHVESRGEVVLNDHSQAVRLFGVVLDITNRKQAEATIQQQEQFLRSIYDGVEAGIFVVDVLGYRGFRYVDSNPAVERMAGAKRENLLNSTPEELLPPETATKVVDQYQACVDSGSRLTFEEQLLINDQQNWWLTSLNPSRDSQGRIHRIIGTTLNITERKRAEEEIAQKNTDLEAAKQAAEKATRVKGEFLANMSHELRTPLNAILGFAQVMQRTLKQDRDRFQQESAKHLQVIQNSGDHLLQLINDVLDMSKIEAGKVEFNPQPFSFYTLLQSLEEMFQLKAAEKHLDLIFDCSLDVPQHIETDEAKLRQILINLLSNAIKFTQTGSVTLGIGGQETLQFKVSDTGCGISPQQLELLFAPFYQTEAGRQSQTGTGLGLAITKTYVELLGGEITIQSALGQGSTFQFTLPVILAEAFEDNTHRPHGAVVQLVPGQPDYRILVVEDKWESRTLLVQLLEPVGFEVKEASNGREAIVLWEDWQPHLIWMDMRMPVMDGYEATQYIRAHVRGQAPAIIALTASALESEKAVILSAGCDDFVRKPFKDTIIFAKLQQHLGVEYIYAHQIPAKIDASESSQPRSLLVPKRLAQLPPEWLAELHDAAGVADAEWIMRLVNKLPDADADIATSLKELLQNFRCDLIEAMASAALGLG